MTVVGDTLCKEDVNGTNVFQYVSYSPERGIEISGSDFGRAPKDVFGSSEYEYWRTVKPEHADRVFFELLKETGLPPEAFGSRLIELIATRFGGTYEAERFFREWCEEKGIPTGFFSWVSGS